MCGGINHGETFSQNKIVYLSSSIGNFSQSVNIRMWKTRNKWKLVFINNNGGLATTFV